MPHQNMESLDIKVVHSKERSEHLKKEIVSLCNRAYEKDMATLFDTLVNASHVLGYYGDSLVSHAAWVPRYLQAGKYPPMRTAYVEAVATEPAYRNRGFASSIMKCLIGEIQDYELAALSPFSVEYYGRLGWELWRGPLFIRMNDHRIRSPQDEEVMIFRLPKTPALDLDAPLSAEWREGELW